ncbi:MAG: peptide ABC transporter substrate-binding protein [Candidatus Pacebacteria bacterium]|nr:peptide ABC transporter substrate-binding protein [Candidatus Paceibacterota bacterium]
MKPSSETSSRFFDKFLSRIESVPGSDRFILRVAFFTVIAMGIWLTLSVNNYYSEVIATSGGSINEGIIGTPRFVNPVLAITRADHDVASLVYSGLLRINTEGNLSNDLAESINVSEDGLTYNIVLRQDITFHDGESLTAADVIYTIRLIQDPDLKSPLRGNWTDIMIEEVGEFELNIVLEEAYAPFIENFTIGIMPAHAWSTLPIEQLPFSQLNTEPIGTGPFSVADAGRDTAGLIKHYSLVAYRENTVNPKIDKIELDFFQNEELLLVALSEKEIDATAYVSSSHIEEVLTRKYQLLEEPLPRSFGIFFNQNRDPALRDSSVREALTVAINRDALIENTLFGHGVPISAPTVILQPELELEEGIDIIATSTPAEQAISILEDAGWIQNDLNLWENEIEDETVILSITLRTSNAPLFESLVDSIAEQWREVGVEVITEQFEQTGLVQSVIRPRDFEALLFGLDMSRSYDLYPFWHSSQQDDPGLNIAQYTNVTVDELLETARTEQDETIRRQSLNEAGMIISEEKPAIFLFQPTLTYLVSDDITVQEMNNIGRPSDRFSNIAEWHTESDSLWPFFRNDDM